MYLGLEGGDFLDPHIVQAVVTVGGIHVGYAAYEGVGVVDHEW